MTTDEATGETISVAEWKDRMEAAAKKYLEEAAKAAEAGRTLRILVVFEDEDGPEGITVTVPEPEDD